MNCLFSQLAVTLLALLLTTLSYATECTMNPAPIDAKRIAQNPLIKSIVFDKKNHKLSALLKNGQTIKLKHSGCDHSGAEVTMWSEIDYVFEDEEKWKKEIIALAKIAFIKTIADDIAHSLNDQRNFDHIAGASFTINVTTSSFFSYSVQILKTESGSLITIAYTIG